LNLSEFGKKRILLIVWWLLNIQYITILSGLYWDGTIIEAWFIRFESDYIKHFKDDSEIQIGVINTVTNFLGKMIAIVVFKPSF